MAYCLSKMDRPQLPAAAAYFEKCLEDGLVTAEILNNLGCIYSQDTARLTEAQAMLDRALGLKPDLQAARHNRALVAYQLAIGPAFGRKLDRDSRAEAQRKLLLAAVEDIERAISIGPASAELHRDAARIYARLGRLDSKWYDHALDQAALAVREGFDPEKLRADAALAPLNGLPRFVALTRKAPDAQPSRAVRLADPLAGALE
jgi:tetratricopeptide (TPR) repeat protein